MLVCLFDKCSYKPTSQSLKIIYFLEYLRFETFKELIPDRLCDNFKQYFVKSLKKSHECHGCIGIENLS